MTTVQSSTPPPPFATPSHWVIEVIGCVELETVVVHVPAPALIGPAAPTHRVSVTDDGVEVAAPLLVRKFWIVMVQEIPWPPTLLATSLLHCEIGALSGAALA